MASDTLQQMIAALITNVMVPELVAFLKARHATQVPTEDELKALLLTTTARSIAVGEAFLRAKGIEP